MQNISASNAESGKNIAFWCVICQCICIKVTYLSWIMSFSSYSLCLKRSLKDFWLGNSQESNSSWASCGMRSRMLSPHQHSPETLLYREVTSFSCQNLDLDFHRETFLPPGPPLFDTREIFCCEGCRRLPLWGLKFKRCSGENIAPNLMYKEQQQLLLRRVFVNQYSSPTPIMF